jgi:hypothetical protein
MEGFAPILTRASAVSNLGRTRRTPEPVMTVTLWWRAYAGAGAQILEVAWVKLQHIAFAGGAA